LRAEAQGRLRDALSQLAEQDREILVLRYLEQLSTADTAAILKLGLSAVKMRHLRAIERLRELLGNQPLDPST
jgi:RNA polymerase sigma-70 factor (ECF subfamily)